MKKEITAIVAMATLLTACSEDKATVTGPQHSQAGAELLAKIEQIAAGDSYMYGHQDTYMYGHTWTLAPEETEMTRSDIMDVCGQYPAVYGIELGGIELGDQLSIDKNDFDQIRLAAQAHHQRGGIITLSWHPRNPLTGDSAWDVSSDQVVKSILPDGENHEKFMVWLGMLADYLESIKDEDGNAIPMIFRPWHEHSGSWFWWGKNLCSEQEYKDLWVLTFDYLVNERGLVDLLWTMSPNAPITVAEYESRYPGDEYVDIIGYDYYCTYTQNPTEEQLARDIAAYNKVMRDNLPEVLAMGQKHGKSIALTETGLQEILYEKFWTDAVAESVKGFPISYVLTWRNERGWVQPDHYFGVFPEGPSSEDFKAWVATPEVLMLDDIK